MGYKPIIIGGYSGIWISNKINYLLQNQPFITEKQGVFSHILTVLCAYVFFLGGIPEGYQISIRMLKMAPRLQMVDLT